MRGIIPVLIAGAILAAAPALADDYPVILHGKVTLPDGSPPPKQTSIQRICSDRLGDAPGPLVNKSGEYLWRMMVDPLRTRECHLEAHLPDYLSSEFDISGLNGYTSTTMEVPALILTPKGGNPRAIDVSMNGVPGKAQGPFRAALKAMDANNMTDMVKQLEAAVQAAPQFARGWDYLGLGYEQIGKPSEARDAYEHSIAADPKLLAAYVNIEILYIRDKEWDKALKNARAAIQLDTRKLFPVMYLHQAVAQFRLNDVDGAKASVEEAIKLDAANKMPRSEYVLGRILLAKGDVDGARRHIMHYFELDPTASDIELLSAHFQKLGTPEAAAVDPDLERP